MIGVPGAGKLWVVRKIRTWIDIVFLPSGPFTSFEYNELNQETIAEEVSENFGESIKEFPKGMYGKSVALASSGCAAAIIEGFTIHHKCSFPVNMKNQINTGELPLPELKCSRRAKRLDSWCSVKVIIIDEVYMLKVEWLSLIDKKLRQMFNSSLPFAGIPVLLSGNHRKIVLVNGKALFTLNKYFTFTNNEITLPPYGASRLSQREEKGFPL